MSNSETKVCKWCGGRGSIPIERGSSTRYTCPDCDGTGILELNEHGKWDAPPRGKEDQDDGEDE